MAVRDPGGAAPTVEVYTTLPTTPNGAMSFAPDGTLYVVSGYLNRRAPVLEISGTDRGAPVITTLTDVTTNFWVTVGETLPDGAAKTLLVLNEDDGVVESIDNHHRPGHRHAADRRPRLDRGDRPGRLSVLHRLERRLQVDARLGRLRLRPDQPRRRH